VPPWIGLNRLVALYRGGIYGGAAATSIWERRCRGKASQPRLRQLRLMSDRAWFYRSWSEPVMAGSEDRTPQARNGYFCAARWLLRVGGRGWSCGGLFGLLWLVAESADGDLGGVEELGAFDGSMAPVSMP